MMRVQHTLQSVNVVMFYTLRRHPFVPLVGFQLFCESNGAWKAVFCLLYQQNTVSAYGDSSPLFPPLNIITSTRPVGILQTP